MIGFYSYTVVLTYLGLASAAMGMILTFQGFAKYALFCLAFSGLCDMFDGKVARMKKDRTEDEKRFGIQIDSLCDVVCFGAFPMILCYSIGMRGPAGISILVFYLIAGVIRLAFFNVMEEKRKFDFVVSRAVMNAQDLVKLVRKNVHHEHQNALPNGLICLKGGDVADELAPFAKCSEVWDLSTYFTEEFFETKKVTYIQL